MIGGRIIGLQHAGQVAEELGYGAALILVLPILQHLLLDVGKPLGIDPTEGAVAQYEFQQPGQATAKAVELQGKAPLMGIDVVAEPR